MAKCAPLPVDRWEQSNEAHLKSMGHKLLFFTRGRLEAKRAELLLSRQETAFGSASNDRQCHSATESDDRVLLSIETKISLTNTRHADRLELTHTCSLTTEYLAALKSVNNDLSGTQSYVYTLWWKKPAYRVHKMTRHPRIHLSGLYNDSNACGR